MKQINDLKLCLSLCSGNGHWTENAQRKTTFMFVFVRVFGIKRKQMKRKWSEYSFKRKKRITEKKKQKQRNTVTWNFAHNLSIHCWLFSCISSSFFSFYFFDWWKIDVALHVFWVNEHTNTWRREKNVCKETDKLNRKKREQTTLWIYEVKPSCRSMQLWMGAFFARSEWLARTQTLWQIQNDSQCRMFLIKIAKSVHKKCKQTHTPRGVRNEFIPQIH